MDRDAAVAKLREAEVAAVPVLDASDRARTPRFRDHLVTMPGTPFPVKGFPSRFSAYRMPLHLRAPVIGEDTERVLADLVGLSRAEIARLDSTGVVHLASGGER